ncbi:basic phospholipase A2 Tbo-G6D49-like [Python bivittatus]|uniref:Basic phospholipase A2 Tbo-G6D49-like n=1 Tax=Python bivittatus TaxID=176946 RepID=A0A9F2RFI1_PYTBI|nr:basic phospholipase A2 Tbo-G6D49-like [Python bivittatus]
MKTFWGLVVLLVGAEGNFFQLGKMIQEETGKSVLAYVWYGCYCGKGRTGQPLDATDSCCKTHNCCYGNLTTCKPKLNIYEYTRQDGVIICGTKSWCKKQICECDKALAICLRENLDTYNEGYTVYWNLKCGKEPLKC